MPNVFRALLILGLVFVAAPAGAKASDLSDAQAFNAAGQYGKAIALLETVVSSGRADADIYNELGRAYNWTHDNANALKYYREAAKRDSKYASAAIQILDPAKQYDEIIAIGETAVTNGNRQPNVLVALLDAYDINKNTKQYDRILELVKTQQYASNGEKNYRLYILAKSDVRAGRFDSAIAYAAQIDDKKFLQFMAGMDLFKPISADARFKRLLRYSPPSRS